MSTYEYSNERRVDPVIRAKVAEIHGDRVAMLKKAAMVLEELQSEMRTLRLDEDDAIYERSYDALWSAVYRISRDAHFMKGIGGDTYIGNLAAGALGEYVVKRGL